MAVTPGVKGPCALVTGYNDRNRLLVMRDGRLLDRAPSVLADPDRYAIGVAAADLDADGREELYIHNTDEYEGHTRDTDLLLDPECGSPDDDSCMWHDLFALGVNSDRGNFRAGRSVAALDRYGTGRYGVFIASYGTPSRYYELGEDGELSDMAEAVGLDMTACGRSLLAGPIVSQNMDLFVGVERGPNRLFRNAGGHFREVAGECGLSDPDGNARGVTLVEDGLACVNWEGSNHIYVTDGAGVATDDGSGPSRTARDSHPDRPRHPQPFRDVTPDSFESPTRARTLLCADFDNDGHDELFVNGMGTENRLFRRRNGEWAEVDPGPATEPHGLGTGAAVADFDNDGTLELLVVHGELAAQPLSLYAAVNDNAWLRIRPTTQYGAPARGATVTLETDRWTKRRLVCAGSGYLCQMEPIAHFGLGGADGDGATPARARVRWPDGREKTITGLSTHAELEVPHPKAPRF